MSRDDETSAPGSTPGSTEPRVSFSDFLYRDSPRLASYAAQLLGGRLTSREDLDQETTTVEKGVKGGLPGVASGDVKHTSAAVKSARQVRAPHDLETVDVLNYLLTNEIVSEDIDEAPSGAIVMAEGTAYFLDRAALEMTELIFGTIEDMERAKPEGERSAPFLKMAPVVARLLKTVPFPSMLLLHREGMTPVVGVLREDGLAEPIPAFRARHGLSGLPGVLVIGIKEIGQDATDAPIPDAFRATVGAAEVLTKALLPANEIRITPIVLIREVGKLR